MVGMYVPTKLIFFLTIFFYKLLQKKLGMIAVVRNLLILTNIDSTGACL